MTEGVLSLPSSCPQPPHPLVHSLTHLPTHRQSTGFYQQELVAVIYSVWYNGVSLPQLARITLLASNVTVQPPPVLWYDETIVRTTSQLLY
jgi:hypothetical protein